MDHTERNERAAALREALERADRHLQQARIAAGLWFALPLPILGAWLFSGGDHDALAHQLALPSGIAWLLATVAAGAWVALRRERRYRFICRNHPPRRRRAGP